MLRSLCCVGMHVQWPCGPRPYPGSAWTFAGPWDARCSRQAYGPNPTLMHACVVDVLVAWRPGCQAHGGDT